MRKDLNIEILNESIAKLAIKFYNKLNFLDNEVIAGIPNYDTVSNKSRIPRGTLLLNSFHSYPSQPILTLANYE